MEEIADKVFGYLLTGGAFLLFTSMNYRAVYLWLKKAEKVPSMVPLIGGIAGAVAVTAAFGFSHPLLILLPLLIDPGSIPLIIRLIFSMIFR